MNPDGNKETSLAANPSRQEAGKRILVMTSVAGERDAVLRGLGGRGSDRIDVVIAGVGPAKAAVSTTKALVKAKYDLVVNAGIAGGFAGRAEVCTLVVADEIIAADLGAETPEGFSGLDELGFGSARVAVDAKLVKRVTTAIAAAGLPVTSGPVLTLSTVTGTAATAQELIKRVPGVAAEAMEGYGVGVAAQEFGVPVLEIRSISNAVGPRNREAWRIKEALSLLEAASAALLEV
ncbi:futalosine hydrolase [Brevibacillus dissolubilis]|uniref:futalosine hydrolase n=1 Tax=Brevibacillus dissolubilis TaxID=1844116 RepID=UPI001117010E|nr:futalosine hydrolase [Brevibacillus dissolubilis]